MMSFHRSLLVFVSWALLAGAAQAQPRMGGPGMGPPAMGGPAAGPQVGTPGMVGAGTFAQPPMPGQQASQNQPGTAQPGMAQPGMGQQPPPPPPPQYQQPVYQQPAYPQPGYQPAYQPQSGYGSYPGNGSRSTRDLAAEREATRRAQAEREQARRRGEMVVEALPIEETRPPAPQRYDPPPEQQTLRRAMLESEEVAGGAQPAPAAPPAQSGPAKPGAGLPGWLLPGLLLLCAPLILSMLRDDAPRMRAGARVEAFADGDAMLGAAERMRTGDHEGAVPLLQSVVRGGGAAAPRARLLLVQCFLRSGLAEVALEELRTLDVADQPLELIYEVARACGEAGHESAARPLYLAILRKDVGFRDVAARVKGATGSSPLASGAVKRPGPDAPTPVVRAASIGRPTPALAESAPEETPTGTEGTLPARFTDIKFLARGGMGVVYEARDRDLERRVAIKMLSPAYCSDADFVERFARESRAIARLTHPSIVAVYDVARQPMPYMVMEFLDGKTLRRVLSEKILTYRQRITVGLAVTRGLQYAHAQGVIHRDVKPENVIVTEDGRTKLVDFGLARLAEPGAASGPQLTQPNVVMGTPSYMAPELYAGVAANPGTDAFSLGRVLRELMSAEGPGGEPAHAGQAMTDLVDRLTHVDPAQRPAGLSEAVAVMERELASMTLAPIAAS